MTRPTVPRPRVLPHRRRVREAARLEEPQGPLCGRGILVSAGGSRGSTRHVALHRHQRLLRSRGDRQSARPRATWWRHSGHDPDVTGLSDLSKDELVDLLEGAVTSGVGRRLEREQRFYDDRLVFETQAKWEEVCAAADAPDGCTGSSRGQADVMGLVRERVVQPDVIASNDLVPSLLDPGAFESDVRQAFVDSPARFGDYTVDQVRFEWRAWLNADFIRHPPTRLPSSPGYARRYSDRSGWSSSRWCLPFPSESERRSIWRSSPSRLASTSSSRPTSTTSPASRL